MSQKSLFDFAPAAPKKPVEQAQAQSAQPITPVEAPLGAEPEKKKRERRTSFKAPDNLPASYFVSASYDGRQRKAVVKLYEPKSGNIYFWYDNTGHKPYCLTNLSEADLNQLDRGVNHEGFDHAEPIDLFDPLQDHEVILTKIVTSDPLAIGGKPSGTIRDIIPEDFPKDAPIKPEVWEAKIKYYQSYIYDTRYLPGMIYEVREGSLKPVVVEQAEQTICQLKTLFKSVTAEELEYLEEWARLTEYPAPKFRRAAIDIEVFAPLSTRVPDPREAIYPVVCCSLYSSDCEKKVLVLKRPRMQMGTYPFPEDAKMEFYDSEEQLLRAIFEILWEYPFVLTFNGDDFDLRYLVHRAANLGIERREIPIEIGKRVCLLKYGVHVDLYKFFFNRSIQIYAFSNKYKDVTLNDVSKAVIGLEKIKCDKAIGDLTYSELCAYCLRDSEITFKLTEFEDELAMKLILVLSRISSMPMEDVSRQGVSRWIRNFMHREHRHRGFLIPNSEDILSVKGKTSTTAIIKGKKYQGAIVVEPVPGVHFNVAVMDFPSLYPSIIKVWNLGYQSINCPHPECRTNIVPNTPHWVCKKERAMESLLIGSLRDLRVSWYKSRSKDKSLPQEQRNWYNVAQGALKVILNASYGVFGAESFDLYCPPVAEATAAIGRHSITQILNHCRTVGIQVLYGDTDSLFLKNPTKEQIEEVVRFTEHELHMGIDVDKNYRYAVFSSRKKNYLGVLEDGSVDVKGLTGKKKHIPIFIKDAFNQMKARLAQVKSPADFEKAKKDIADIVRNRYNTLKRREWKDNDDALPI
jgi:DNA polymerase I